MNWLLGLLAGFSIPYLLQFLRFIKDITKKPLLSLVSTELSERTVLVGLSGKAGSGKSTIAQQLVDNYGFIKLSFSEELKRLCWHYFPSIMALGKLNELCRKTLQKIGQVFRDINPNVWVNILISQLNYHLARDSNVRIVVDDVRYLNEVHALLLHGFTIIRVERDVELRKQAGYNVSDFHQSEVELDDYENWDLVVWNNGEYPFTEAVETIVAFLGLDGGGEDDFEA